MYFTFCLISDDEGAPQPRVQTPTYTRVECLNLNANTHTAAVIFHRGARWKNAHTHKPIVGNKRASGINFSDSVC